MAQYMLLKDLSLGQHNGSIKVRVSREWEGRKSGSVHVTKKNYLLIDEEGTQVQALTSQYSLIASFTKKLKLGNVYLISKYTVEGAADSYRPVSGDYVITFQRKTEVESLSNIPTIPRYKFEITTFDAAKIREGDVTLMDVAGKLTKYTPIHTTNAGKRKVEIVLTNERNETIKVTLWENQGRDFLQAREDYHAKPNVFLIVTSTTTKFVNGEHVLWSSSSTQFFFNINDPSIVALRANSNMKDDLVAEILPVINTQIQTTTEEIKKITIQQLFDAQLPEGKDTVAFLTEATVFGIVPNYGWYYMGCTKCGKKVNATQQCMKCPKNKEPPIPRYKVTLEVEDATSETTFIIFDKNVMKLISVSAEHILNNDMNATQDMVPAILNNMLGKRCMFQLSLTSYNTVKKDERFTVTQVKEIKDDNIINAQPPPENPENPGKQLEHDNGPNMEYRLENKRKIDEDESEVSNESEVPAPLTSSATKEPVAKQACNKRHK